MCRITLQQVGKKWQELLVQQVMAASTNRAEQSPEQQKVVVGFFGGLSQLHGAVHDLMEVRLNKEEPENTFMTYTVRFFTITAKPQNLSPESLKKAINKKHN